VPIVEPEVLLDGDHDIDRTLEVAEAVWAETFKYLADNKVLFEGILLKPAMVTPGADHKKKSTPEEVADYTLKLLKRRVPPAVPGQLLRLSTCCAAAVTPLGCPCSLPHELESSWKRLQVCCTGVAFLVMRVVPKSCLPKGGCAA
jgi:hypothetical protein